MKEALSSLDQEHDVLRSEADSKDETIQQLQQQLNEKVQNMYIQCASFCLIWTTQYFTVPIIFEICKLTDQLVHILLSATYIKNFLISVKLYM